MKTIPLAISLLLAAAPAPEAVDDEHAGPVQIAYREQTTNFWGEREVTIHLDISAREAFVGDLHWSLQAAGRSLISRSARIQVAAGEKAAVEVRYTLPAVKDAVIYPIELLAWAEVRGQEPVAKLRERFYLFGVNPFVERQEWLRSLKIQLFDPESTTAEAFEKLNIPFGRITNLASIEELQDGVLIIGEDLAWEEHGEIGSLFLRAAARGVKVLCLAGSRAELPLSSPERGLPANAQRLTFRQADVLRDLDKRLSMHWTGAQGTIRQSVELVAEHDHVFARAAASELGWPWMEVHFPPRADQSGALIWCGLGLVRAWEESPTPRYFLLSWLEGTENVAPEVGNGRTRRHD